LSYYYIIVYLIIFIMVLCLNKHNLCNWLSKCLFFTYIRRQSKAVFNLIILYKIIFASSYTWLYVIHIFSDDYFSLFWDRVYSLVVQGWCSCPMKSQRWEAVSSFLLLACAIWPQSKMAESSLRKGTQICIEERSMLESASMRKKPQTFS
jgi:hypothetical protein